MDNIILVDVKNIKRGERLFRTLSVEDMSNLVESIKENGILTPLLVIPADDGCYALKSGYNRLDAATTLGLDKVPCIVVAESKDIAATFDTDIIRRHLSPQEKAEMVKLMRYHRDPDLCTENIINEFMSIKNLLSKQTLIMLSQMSKDDQMHFYKSIPEKHKEDLVRVKELEKERDQHKLQVSELTSIKKKFEDEIKELKEISQLYNVLKTAKQAELDKVVEEKTKELERKYQTSDDAVKVAVESERERVAEELQKEIDEARKKQNEFSRLADQKASEILIANDKITKLSNAIADARAEQEKTHRQNQYLLNVVGRVASLKTVVERGKAVLIDLDQIRHNIILCGDEVLLQDKTSTKTIHDLLDKAQDILGDIKDALNSKIDKRITRVKPAIGE